MAEAKRAAANRAKAARAGGRHLDLNPYHERRAAQEAEAAEHAARRASTKEQRTRAWEWEQAAADYDDDDSFGWGGGGKRGGLY